MALRLNGCWLKRKPTLKSFYPSCGGACRRHQRCKIASAGNGDMLRNWPRSRLTSSWSMAARPWGRCYTGDPHRADRVRFGRRSVGAGFVASLARPGGNATDFMQFEYSLTGNGFVPGVLDALKAARHRRRRPTPTRISTPPRCSEAPTIWSTMYANRSPPNQLASCRSTCPVQGGARRSDLAGRQRCQNFKVVTTSKDTLDQCGFFRASRAGCIRQWHTLNIDFRCNA